ncbi:MAG: hypothetical protein AAFS10_10770, partial [Myxococcota bacterium]
MRHLNITLVCIVLLGISACGGSDGSSGGTTAADSNNTSGQTSNTTTGEDGSQDTFVCGNALLEEGELCDGPNLDGATCSSLGFAAGSLACGADCQTYNFEGCASVCEPDCANRACGPDPLCGVSCGDCAEGACDAAGQCTEGPLCGNGARDPGELCDGEDLAATTCATLGFSGGSLGCNADCQGYDFAACTQDGGGDAECGNGLREAGELCDSDDLDAGCSDLGFDGGELGCTADCNGYDVGACTRDGEGPVCGNNVQEPGELCDGEAISTTCTDLGFDGGDLGCSEGCEGYDTRLCTREDGGDTECGNDLREPGELCDGNELDASCSDLGFDGGTLSCAEGCDGYVTTACTREGGSDAECGNGLREPGELCDSEDIAASCEGLGFDGGDLGCAETCLSYETEACTRDTGGMCGNNVREPGELCDGTDVAVGCTDLVGFMGGDLGCAANCLAYDTSGCEETCVADCAGRVCGPDPNCGVSCGPCNDGMCTSEGLCVPEGGTGPRFIRLNRNVDIIYEGETILFSAVVTDPDGIDDLIGGSMIDPDTGRSYGAFSTSASEGSYEIELTWDEIHRVRPIDALEDGVLRVFEAEFFDVAGNRAAQTIDLSIDCREELDGICDGTCTNLSTTDDCGTCGNACLPGGSCVDQVCGCDANEGVCDAQCVSLITTSNCGECGNVCNATELCDMGECTCGPGLAACGSMGACVS